jgi:hypothetical protein
MDNVQNCDSYKAMLIIIIILWRCGKRTVNTNKILRARGSHCELFNVSPWRLQSTWNSRIVSLPAEILTEDL